MPELFAYTDGACSGNPGPGGWGALLIARDGDTVLRERTLNGGEADTTNNRMELLAAINALEALERPATITVVTDSVYVLQYLFSQGPDLPAPFPLPGMDPTPSDPYGCPSG